MQWNCCSISDKRDDLLLLIEKYKPNIIALNETWFSANTSFSIPGFKIARKDRQTRGGGVLLAFANDLIVTYETIKTHYEFVSCRIRLSDRSSISVASIYLPSPSFNVSLLHMRQAIEQMETPRIILSDFNSHGTDWGCSYNDRRSHMLTNVFDECDLTVLNTDAITRVAAPPALSSAIDLSLCSSNAALECTWTVSDCLSRSDHLPIIIEYRRPPELTDRTRRTRPLSRHIDWESYRTFSTDRITSHACEWAYEDLMSAIKISAVDAQTVPRCISQSGDECLICDAGT